MSSRRDEPSAGLALTRSGAAPSSAPSAPAIEPAGALEHPPRTLWRAAGQRFIRHRLGVVGLMVLLVFTLLGLLAPLLAPYPYQAQDLLDQFAAPSSAHWLGTDALGRDVLSRLLHAARVTLLVVLVSTTLAASLGVFIGALAAYLGGWIEVVLMRLTDAMLSLPLLALLLVLSRMLRELTFLRQTFGADALSLIVIVLVLTLFGWMPLARLVHGSVLSLKQQDFVLAARALGAPPWRIITRHLLPNALAPIVVQVSLGFGTAVILEGTLSYLGLGITPPNPSLGNMLADAQTTMFRHPWLAVYPGLVIFFMVLAINFVGDALRDALDPRAPD